MNKTVPELIDLAGKVVEEYGDTELAAAAGKFGANGVDGELKNLIFGADGPKPRIVLRDAISNIIEVVENGEFCLIYDRPLAANGLTWRELVDWWSHVSSPAGAERARALDLYDRLIRSLDNDAERLIFRTYCERYGRDGFDLPALIPQVYLRSICPNGPRGSSPAPRRVRRLPLRRARADRQGSQLSNAQHILRCAP
ncbi:MAG: hypothetical protein J0I49_07665 [Pseudonocardia sp.]|uniref:hypothetical protein n=1 Tax=Pseudonocardia sp. TaxID=60912 RepID=UPI001AD57C49|nr:hypothetical protein [Pseudonocardia sp.]MBN9097968.1 hypothetical protein [Pseudonocardia sp.]